MATKTIDIRGYKLFPSPRNLHREVFELQVFLPYPYALIVLADFDLRGKATLFAACRASDGKISHDVGSDRFRPSLQDWLDPGG